MPDFDTIAEPLRELRERVKTDIRGNAYTYLAPSDEPLSWDMKGLVRLDVAVLALRLATARFTFRSLPVLVQIRVEKTKRDLAEAAAQKAAGWVLSAAAKKLLKFVTLLYDTWKAAEFERDVERALRSAYLRTMRDLLANKMKPNPGRKRVTKRVASRHK